MDDEARLIKVLRSFGQTLETDDLCHLCNLAADKIVDLRRRLDESDAHIMRELEHIKETGADLPDHWFAEGYSPSKDGYPPPDYPYLVNWAGKTPGHWWHPIYKPKST